MHKYMHHIGDFMRDTNYLTSLEECFYRRAIDFYYLKEKPLPKETQVVMKRLRAVTQEERDALTLVLNDFFTLEDDGFHNKRCDSEIAIYQGNSEKNRKNGKLGGRPKKINNLENLEETQVVISENPSESQSKGNQQPTTNNQQPYIQDKPEKFVFKKALIDLGVDSKIVDEWIVVRKTKKASNTETALKGFIGKVEKSGIDLNTALKICVERSWTGFDKSWLENVNLNDYRDKQDADEKPKAAHEYKEAKMLW